ncbi:MAG TPA: SAM-dependent methyltransferase [Chloroflexota bacterium]
MSIEPAPQGNQLLIGEIRRAIERAGGRIPFRDYMELALYHPGHGYYASGRQRVGRRGDFLTSPHVSPLFAECLARFIGSGPVLELGPGDGLLGRQLAPRFEYVAVDRGQALPDAFEATVISNELLDALPVHRLIRDQERYVRSDFSEELGPYSTPRLEEYFARLGLQPAGEAEVNLDTLDLMSAVYARLAKGQVLTIDYGYEAAELFVGHPQGTFLTYERHTADADPYVRIGEKDMTAHVDFTSLMALGEASGLHTVTFTTQADFLADLGLGELLVSAQAAATDASAYAALRQAAIGLLDPSGLGGFRVLVQQKG